jgi:hypothetical protein
MVTLQHKSTGRLIPTITICALRLGLSCFYDPNYSPILGLVCGLGLTKGMEDDERLIFEPFCAESGVREH